MTDGDFYSSEQSVVIQQAGNLNIELIDAAGTVTALKQNIAVQDKEIIDAAVMSRKALREFFEQQTGQERTGHSVICASESNYDESLRSDYFRSCGFCLLQRCV